MKLFGTDGVRGKAGEKIDPFLSMKLAMAVGIYFKKHAKTKRIIVGKDTRRSGYMIENAIVSGLTAVGYDVIQIGPMPTPAVAFLTEDMRCDAGIMISASHNPFEDNGIKIFDAYGNKLDESIEKEIEDIFFNEELLLSSRETGKKIGSAQRIDDVIGRYIVHIKSSFPSHCTLQNIRIVLDTANGAAYKVAPTIFEELGADLIVVNDRPNGFNINDNCGAMHPENLAKLVKMYRADIGIALDGDADRLVVIDENGEKVDGDKLIAVLGVYLKKKNKLSSDAIVATVMSNEAMGDYLKKNNLKLIRSNVGDKYVLEEMKKNNINFGGEQSGHIIFSDYAKTGDGLVSALQVLAYMVENNLKCSEAFNKFELYPQVQSNINVSKKIPLEKIEGLKEKLKEIEDKGFRHLIRYSGTENKLRLLIEGKDKNIAKSLLQNLENFFKKILND